MRRIIKNLAGAMLGAGAGFVLYQLRTAVNTDDENGPQLIVAAPLTNAAVAAGVGVLAGRRGPLAAFVVGATISAFFGSLDDSVPAVAGWREAAVEKAKAIKSPAPD